MYKEHFGVWPILSIQSIFSAEGIHYHIPLLISNMPISIAPNNSASLLNAAIVAPATTRHQSQQTHTNSVRRHASAAEDTLHKDLLRIPLIFLLVKNTNKQRCKGNTWVKTHSLYTEFYSSLLGSNHIKGRRVKVCASDWDRCELIGVFPCDIRMVKQRQCDTLLEVCLLASYLVGLISRDLRDRV